MIAAGAAFAVLAAAGQAAAAAETPSVDSVEARREAYFCTSRAREAALPSCRKALALGLSPRRAATVNLVLGLHLAALGQWDAVVAAYREAVRLAPQDATARWRLGDALLYGLGKPDAACASLREAVRLDSRLAGAHLSLGVALNAAGAHAEAVSAFDEALRLDPRIFENHPVARAALEASRRGRRWTP